MENDEIDLIEKVSNSKETKKKIRRKKKEKMLAIQKQREKEE